MLFCLIFVISLHCLLCFSDVINHFVDDLGLASFDRSIVKLLGNVSDESDECAFVSAGPRLDNGKNAISVVEFRKGFGGLSKSSPAGGITQGECGSWALRRVRPSNGGKPPKMVVVH